MTRLFCLSVNVALAVSVPITAQEKQDPPKEFTNGIGMKFVWISPGSFMMGSPQEEKQRGVNETRHKVRLTKGLYLGIHLVTQEQWQAVMDNNPSRFKGEKNLPVEKVSWDDCQEFIKKLGDKDKKLYRLPTEAEWEYACRAGTTTPFSLRRNHLYGVGKLQWHFHLWQRQEGRFSREDHAGRQLPGQCIRVVRHARQSLAVVCRTGTAITRENDVVDPQGPEKGEGRVLRGGSWNLRSRDTAARPSVSGTTRRSVPVSGASCAGL